MATRENYYSVLQVPPDAELDTIKQAYRKKIRLYHPDQFEAELSRVRQGGDRLAIKQLEDRVSRAKKMTQQINEAYAVLSDPVDRVAYDRYLSEERQRQYYDEIRQQRMQHYDGGRRTVKSRPHSQNPNFKRNADQDERIPWIMLVLLMSLVMFSSIWFSNVFSRNNPPITTYVPGNTTSAGGIQASDLQATANSQQATIIARRTIVFHPTGTPRPASANETLGDRLIRFGQIEQALDAYTDAINANPGNANLFIKRAAAYTALYEDDIHLSEVLEVAIADYSTAIELDDTLVNAYVGRGFLYYELWLSDGTFADEARSDLQHYLNLDTQADTTIIQEILDELGSADASSGE